MEEKLTLYTGLDCWQDDMMSVYVSLLEKGLNVALEPVIPNQFDVDALEEKQHISCLQCEFPDKVPLLCHGPFILFESTAIDEYLEERFSPPFYQALYPLDICLKAKTRQLQVWLRRHFKALKKERPIGKISATPITTELSKEATIEAERLFCVAQALLPISNKFLFGPWSIVDSELSLMLNRLVLNGDHVPARLKNYALVQWERPSIQQWIKLNFSQTK